MFFASTVVILLSALPGILEIAGMRRTPSEQRDYKSMAGIVTLSVISTCFLLLLLHYDRLF